MKEAHKIAVVILNWNGAKLFPVFLPSIIEHSQAENIDIIVADNGSTDNSLTILEKDFPEVAILDLRKNYGFAQGYNVALDKINAEYFVLVNSDVKVEQGWIESCINRFETDTNIACIQPKVRSYNNPEYFEYAGAGGGFIDKFGYPFCRGRILDCVEKDCGQYNTPDEIFWATGACLFIKADVFKKTGGFDTDFWAHMEEIDLCWRIKNRGYKIVYEPQSVIYHLGGGTLSYGNPRKIYLNFRNNLFMLFKNLPGKKFAYILLTRMILDGIAATKFLLGLEWKAFIAVVQAHASFYKHLPSLCKKRKHLKTKATANNLSGVYHRSIMWNFYLQKKNKFSMLKL